MSYTDGDRYMRTPSPHQYYYNRPKPRQVTLKSNNPYSRYSMPPVSLELGPVNHERSQKTQSVLFPSGYHHQGQNLAEPMNRRESRRESTSTSTRDSRRESTNPFIRRGRSGYRHSTMVLPDVIDRLDNVSGYQYHHDGPYDAVCPERNRISHYAPVEALKESNEEALKATPPEKIRDALDKHRPLDGTAYYPPGYSDHDGRVYEYQEGANMMSDYGNLHRCAVPKFTDQDFANDPFYTKPFPKPFAALRKKISRRLHRSRRRVATA